MKGQEFICVRGARVHNLKNLSIDIPKNALVVITGLSGSGKSSLAFDTIHAEGQRRYMESLSSYARQFLELQDKPDVDEIRGLSPTVAIDQKSSSHNPRSTVGTVTEVYDYLRVLFARAGVPQCPRDGCPDTPLQEQALPAMAERESGMVGQDEVLLLSPVVQKEKGEHKHVLLAMEQAGFDEVRYDGLLMDLAECIRMRKEKKKEHSIEGVAARFAAAERYTGPQIEEKVKRALEHGGGRLIVVNHVTGDEQILSKHRSCGECGFSFPEIEPRLFSFNSPHGACAACMGLGVKLVLEEDLVIPNKRLTFAEGAIKPWTRIAGNQTSYLRMLECVGEQQGFSLHVPVGKIPKKKLELILRGTGDALYFFDGKQIPFEGVLTQLEEKYRTTDSDYVRSELKTYMREMVCPDCEGKRLSREALAVRLWGESISDLSQRPIEDLEAFFSEPLGHCHPALTLEQQLVIGRVKKDVLARLSYMQSVGLGYLTLDRPAMTLSGGESQRMRLATQLGASLSGIIYILDEPSIGLHPLDNDQLI